MKHSAGGDHKDTEPKVDDCGDLNTNNDTLSFGFGHHFETNGLTLKSRFCG